MCSLMSRLYYSTKRRWLTTTKKLATMLEFIVAIMEPLLCNDSAKYKITKEKEDPKNGKKMSIDAQWCIQQCLAVMQLH